MRSRSRVAGRWARCVPFAAALLLAWTGRAGATVITAFPVNFAVAEQSDPNVNADPQAGEPAAAPAIDEAAEQRERARRLREEHAKFLKDMDDNYPDLTGDEVHERLENHLVALGLLDPYDPPVIEAD